jgi:hypothetical protein
VIQVDVHDVGQLLASLSIEVPANYRGHSGHLSMSRPFGMTIEDAENHFWQCVAVRTGSARLTTSYDESADVVIDIWPGAPLMLPTSEAPPIGFVLEALEEGTYVEALFFESDIALVEVLPNSAFLVLNAGAGVTLGDLDESLQVKSWRDVRPESGAPDEFALWAFITGGGANFIAEDPDFAGMPSVEWTSDNAGGYRYASETSGLWDFLGSGGEFLFMAIMKPPSDLGGDSVFWQPAASPGPGMTLSFDGGYRSRIRLYDDEVPPAEDLTEIEEVIEGAPMVLVFSLTSDGVRVYRQGRWELLSGAVAGNAAASLSRPVLGVVGADVLTGTKIADLRIWKTMPDDIDAVIASYTAVAVADYGVDDTVRQGYPWVTGAYGYLRANRGYSRSSTQYVFNPATDLFTSELGIQAWIDTRPESVAPDFAQTGLAEQPGWSQEGLNGNAAIRPYGMKDTTLEMQHLEAAAVWTPIDSQVAFTVTIIFETTTENDPGGVLFSTRNSITGDDFAGTALLYMPVTYAFRAQMDDGTAALIDEIVASPVCTPGATMAACVRFDPAAGKMAIDILNVDTGVMSTTVYFADVAWTPLASTLPPRLFRGISYNYGWTAFEGFCGEFGAIAGYATDEKVDQFRAYAARRYAP